MSKSLSKYLDGINNPEVFEDFDNSLERFDIKKGTLIFKEGDVSRNLYFIESGMVRQYYYTKAGKEVTEYFAFENMGFGCIESMLGRKPSYLYAEALVDSIIRIVDLDKIEELCKKHIEFEYAYRNRLEMALVFTQIRMRSILFQTALERYENLLKDYPSILQLVSTKHIASYLGVSRETLSRMKAM
jgi:CRP-like cAMP-binding protein